MDIYEKGNAFFDTLGFSKDLDEVFKAVKTQQSAIGKYSKFCSVVTGGTKARKYTSNEGIDRAQKWEDGKSVPRASRHAGYTLETEAEFYANGLELTYQAANEAYQSKDARLKLLEALMEDTVLLTTSVNSIREEHAADLLNGAFATTIAPDGLSLINAAHAWKTAGAATWSNTITVGATQNKVLSIEALEEVNKLTGAFKDPFGNAMPVRVDTIIVKAGSTAEATAMKLFGEEGKFVSSTQDGVNVHRNQIKEIISLEYLTSDTAYFFADSRYFKKALKAHIHRDTTMLPEAFDYDTRSSKKDIVSSYTFDVVDMPCAIYGSKGTDAA